MPRRPCRVSWQCWGPMTFPAATTSRPSARTSRFSAIDRVEFAGQTLAMVVAETLDAARAAAAKVVVEIEAEHPILDIATALARESYVQAPATILRGDPDAALAAAPHRLTAEFSVGGQSISIWRARSPSHCPVRMATSPSIPRPSIRPRSSMSAPGCWLGFQPRDGGRAPSGRRLRRQGKQCELGRGPRRPSRRTTPDGR